VNPVIKAGEKRLSTIQMLVRVRKFPDCSVQHPEIVFDTRLMSCELGLLEIDTRSTKLNQRSVCVILPLLGAT
jgi:hypothetical protein